MGPSPRRSPLRVDRLVVKLCEEVLHGSSPTSQQQQQETGSDTVHAVQTPCTVMPDQNTQFFSLLFSLTMLVVLFSIAAAHYCRVKKTLKCQELYD